MNRCHSIPRLLILGLICLNVTACNGWQSAAPPPQGNVSEASIEITEPSENLLQLPEESDTASPSDKDARPRNAVKALRPYYEWTDSETAADSLGRMGPAAVPNLMEALQDSNPLVRSLACRVLARIGPEAVIAVPNLIKLLDDDDARVRREATRALGQVGPAAAESIPALIRLLKEAEPTDVDDAAVTVELDERISQ